jgi:hypothetical protein
MLWSFLPAACTPSLTTHSALISNFVEERVQAIIPSFIFKWRSGGKGGGGGKGGEMTKTTYAYVNKIFKINKKKGRRNEERGNNIPSFFTLRGEINLDQR